MCQGFSHFPAFLHHSVLEKLVTSSILVNVIPARFHQNCQTAFGCCCEHECVNDSATYLVLLGRCSSTRQELLHNPRQVWKHWHRTSCDSQQNTTEHGFYAVDWRVIQKTCCIKADLMRATKVVYCAGCQVQKSCAIHSHYTFVLRDGYF